MTRMSEGSAIMQSHSHTEENGLELGFGVGSGVGSGAELGPTHAASDVEPTGDTVPFGHDVHSSL